MPKTPDPQIPRRLAERHDALFEKLQALTRRVQREAARGPGRGVPEDLRTRAEALLFEVQSFREAPRGKELPLAAPHFSGLAAQLGEAMALMVAFEMRHSQWNAAINDAMWMVPGAMMRPRRLGPRPGSKGAARADARERLEAEARAARMVELRAKLVKRLDQYYRRDPPPPQLSSLSPAPRRPL